MLYLVIDENLTQLNQFRVTHTEAKQTYDCVYFMRVKWKIPLTEHSTEKS